MEPCKCCGGTGVQTRYDGVKVKCPACGGSGNWQIDWQPFPYTPIPYYPPYYPYGNPFITWSGTTA
jgi:hypothetical protein